MDFGFTLTLQETRSIHASMNIQNIECIAYIYILKIEIFQKSNSFVKYYA